MNRLSPGDRLMVDGVLYKVTQVIDNGRIVKLTEITRNATLIEAINRTVEERWEDHESGNAS